MEERIIEVIYDNQLWLAKKEWVQIFDKEAFIIDGNCVITVKQYIHLNIYNQGFTIHSN